MNDTAKAGDTETSTKRRTTEAGKAASDRIADQLRETIISGAVVSGTALAEARLCATYGASRNTVREALRQLRTEGLVVNIRHRGVIVRTLTPADVRDIYRVRRTLELCAIAQSAFARDQQLQAIGEAVHRQEQAMAEAHWRAVGTWSLRFHQCVVALLASERLDECFRSVVAQLRLIFALYPNEKHFQSPWVIRDRQIYDLIRRGQRQEAGDAMRLYLEDSEARVLDVVRLTHHPE